MTTRTFKQRGLGYGTVPVNIVVKINGTIAYEGPVTTVDEPFPAMPENEEDREQNVPLFAWTNTVDFEGIVSMEISVVGNGHLLIARTVANYCLEIIEDSEGKDVVVSSGPDKYLPYYSKLINDIIISDPFLEPKIDGVEVARIRDLDPNNQLTGQWFYLVPGGSTFTGILEIQPGIEERELQEVVE